MIPAQAYPATVLLVDDDLDFLESLVPHLDPHLHYKLFDSPREVLSYIQAQQDVNKISGLLDEDLLRISYNEQTPSLATRSLKIALDKIHHTVYNPRRFSQICCVVVDYSMPEMNGLELCTKLSTSTLNRILLTAEADAMIGVEAFNVGLIHHFLKKQSVNLVPQLKLAISQMWQRTLNTKTALLNSVLDMAAISFLADPSCQALVQKIAQHHGFVEHYLMVNPDGLLLLRADGSAMRLIIETAAGFQAHLEAAEAADAPQSLLTALSHKKILPCFIESGGLYGPECVDWERHVYPAECCIGQEVYYWALAPADNCIDTSQIYSYDDFIYHRPIKKK